MIFDAILGLLAALIGAVFDVLFALIPTPPGELVTMTSDAWDLMAEAYVMDHWLPIDLGFILAAAVLTAYGVSAIVGIVRLIVSYFTLGSGAT